jgi:hypothetical protein
MKYSNGLVISTVALAILTTGCVKKPANERAVVYDNSQQQTVYDTTTQGQTVYETAAPIIYDNTAVTPSGTIYTGEATDNTVITTTDAYGGAQSTTSGNSTYGQPAVSNNGAFNDPYASSNNYPDPYANGAQSSAPDYGYNSSTTTASSGGIQLQIAALNDYYAAEEFKNSLSLDPKYSAYVKRGSVNKVIVTGFDSRGEAMQLKDRQFPGAFIVSGSAAPANSSYVNNSGYTTNTPYGGSSSSSSASFNGIGVQIGAYSSRSKAQGVAESASSKYAPFVKVGNSNGRTIYKAILTGFASESAARSFIANRGSGFLVHGL